MESKTYLNQKLLSYSKKEEVKYKYSKGEIVYSLWKGQLWKAIILDSCVKMNPNGWHPIYYVGYITNQKKLNNKNYSYNKNHNEWKSEALIFEINERTKKISIEIQKMLLNALKKDETSVKNILDELRLQEEINISVLKYNKTEDEWFNFTNIIYSVLINDKKQIENRNLVVLPKKPNINQIIKDYIENTNNSSKKKKKNKSELIEDDTKKTIMDILVGIFNKNLRRGLLYPIEVHQANYFDKKIGHSNYSEIYGIEHLLRLLIKLPRFINNISYGDYNFDAVSNYSDLNNDDFIVIKILKNNIVKTVNSLILYLNDNISRLSIGKYENIQMNI